MRFLHIIAIILACAFITAAQSYDSDRCVLSTLDISGINDKNLEKMRDVPEKPLGTFETVIAEDTLTTRVYRLPRTNLFVIASVYYTDESMASKTGADSISLELLISKSRRRSLVKALHYADGEVPYANFEVARVSTIVSSAGKRIIVGMECRTQKTQK